MPVFIPHRMPFRGRFKKVLLPENTSLCNGAVTAILAPRHLLALAAVPAQSVSCQFVGNENNRKHQEAVVAGIIPQLS